MALALGGTYLRGNQGGKFRPPDIPHHNLPSGIALRPGLSTYLNACGWAAGAN